MQVERERYATEDFQRKPLEELVEQFNREHPGMNIQIPNTNSKCIIETIRNTAENEDGILIRQDKSVVVGRARRRMPDSIEIECRSRDRIKVAKQSLIKFLEFMGIDAKTVITKVTREEQAAKIMQMEGTTAEKGIE